MEEFKSKLKEIKRLSISQSLEDSHKCWELYPIKNKNKYKQCSFNASVSYHVYSQGKRELYKVKAKGLAECEKKLEPVAFKTCMQNLYKRLHDELPSLEQWIHREREKIDWLKF